MFNIIDLEDRFIGIAYELLAYFEHILNISDVGNPTIRELINELRNDFDDELLEIKFDYDFHYTVYKLVREEQ